MREQEETGSTKRDHCPRSCNKKSIREVDGVCSPLLLSQVPCLDLHVRDLWMSISESNEKHVELDS